MGLVLGNKMETTRVGVVLLVNLVLLRYRIGILEVRLERVGIGALVGHIYSKLSLVFDGSNVALSGAINGFELLLMR
jgi:hypothetical protein